MKKTRGAVGSHCVSMSWWGLRELGIIGNGDFKGVVGGTFRVVDKELFNQHCIILDFYEPLPQLLEEGKLLPGDICSYVEGQHTNVYAGNGLWYDSGTANATYDPETKQHILFTLGPRESAYKNRTIGQVVRIIK